MPRCLAHGSSVLLAIACAAHAAPLLAQTPARTQTPPPAAAAATAPTPEALSTATLRGATLDGQAFDLQRLRGKVVLLVFWSTECAVCRDKMPELRANVKGWAGQPFEVIGISTDRDRRSLVRYQQLVDMSVPAAQRFTALWRGEPGHQDSFGDAAALPAAYLIDKQGKVVESHHGRIPPETWDRIAELL